MTNAVTKTTEFEAIETFANTRMATSFCPSRLSMIQYNESEAKTDYGVRSSTAVRSKSINLSRV